MWLVKQELTRLAEVAGKSPVALPNSVNVSYGGVLHFYLKVVNFLLKQCATSDNTFILDNELRALKQVASSVTIFSNDYGQGR